MNQTERSDMQSYHQASHGSVLWPTVSQFETVVLLPLLSLPLRRRCLSLELLGPAPPLPLPPWSCRQDRWGKEAGITQYNEGVGQVDVFIASTQQWKRQTEGHNINIITMLYVIDCHNRSSTVINSHQNVSWKSFIKMFLQFFFYQKVS